MENLIPNPHKKNVIFQLRVSKGGEYELKDIYKKTQLEDYDYVIKKIKRLEQQLNFTTKIAIVLFEQTIKSKSKPENFFRRFNRQLETEEEWIKEWFKKSVRKTCSEIR